MGALDSSTSLNLSATPANAVAVTTGGMTLSLLFDAAAIAAPERFRAGIEHAASMLTAAISGRVPYGPQPDIFDLFRFTAPGERLFQFGNLAPAAYFSVDGGITKLADYGEASDASDFLNSGVQGPNDPFNEFYSSSTSQQLSA